MGCSSVSALAENMEAGKGQNASLNDIFGMMGGLMSALAPPKDAEAIKGGMDELSLVMGGLFEGVANEAVVGSHEIPTTVGKPIYEWVPINNKEKLPENALLAAKDHGNAVYVGRGVLDGKIRLGKYQGKEEEVMENIEVLCVDKDAKVKWVDCESGVVPAGAIVGTIVNGKSEFVGRGIVDDELSPGRIVRDDKCMYAPYGGREEVLTKCQALVIQNAKPVYQWVPVENWNMPKDAIPAAKDASDYWNIFIGRTALQGKIRLAKIHTIYRKLYVAHRGKEEEIINEPFEVLCADKGAKVEWKAFADGKVPARAVLGSIVDGRLEFVGRGKTRNEISVGAIVPSDGCMYAPYGGKCETLTKYEALVIQ